MLRVASPPLRLAVAASLAAICVSASAQDAARTSGFAATLESSLAYIDTKGSPTNNGSDIASQLRPGFRFSSRSGRIQGSADYGLSLVHHSRDSSGSESQSSLRAAFTAEAVPNWMFVDATATAARSAISAFGAPAIDGSLQGNKNVTDVGTVSVSPYVRGPIGSVATYLAKLDARATNTRRSKTGDSTSVGSQLSINSASTGSRFGWGLSATRDHAAFRTSSSSDNERLLANLSFRPDPELRLTLRGGQETSNALSGDSKRYDNWGAGGEWSPNERTQAAFNTDKRYFGQSHQFSLSYRLPLSSLTYSSVKDVSTGAGPNGFGRPTTLYELYYSFLTSTFPDPVLREQAVLTQLQIEGKDPNTLVIGGFVNSGLTLQRRNDLAWAYAGKRLGLSLQANTTHSGPLEGQATPTGDGPIAQKGYSSTLSWRLTPISSVSLNGQRLMTRPTLTHGGTDLKSLGLNLTNQLGRRTSANFGARYTVFNSDTDPYRESSLTASLSMRF